MNIPSPWVMCRRGITCALLAVGVFLAPATQTHAQVQSIAVLPADASAQGQIVVMGRDGQEQLRLTGFQKPARLSYNADGRIFVYDLATRDIIAVSDTGNSFALSRTWRLPPEASDPVGFFSDNPESMTVIDRNGNIFRFTGNNGVEQFPPPAGMPTMFTSSTSLSDGRTLLVRSDIQDVSQSMFAVRLSDRSFSPISVTGLSPQEGFPPSGVSSLGDTVFIWRGGNSNIFGGTLSGNTLSITKRFHYESPSIVIPDPDGGITVITFAGKIARLSPSGEVLKETQFISLPIGAVFSPSRNTILLLHEYPKSEEWPERRNRVLSHQAHSFAWGAFFKWFTPAALLALLWSLLAARRGYEPPPPLRSAPVQRDNSSHGALLVWSLICLVVVAVGLYIEWGAQALLLDRRGKEEWSASYLFGAILVGLVVEAWRRFHPPVDEPTRFLSVLKEPAPPLGRAYVVPLVVVGLLSGLLYRMGIDTQYNGGLREAAFFSGVVFVVGLLAVDCWVCRANLKEWLRRERFFIAVPLLVGGFTFFFRLEDIPYNTHFDFTLNGFVAEQFLRGNKDGAWDWGYVPAPVIGKVPEILGFLIAGFTPFGYRVGNALFNCSAILAVYLIGREYRNPRVGFWAALLLAGNPAFIHFGRLMSNGSAATVAIWALAAFSLAIKHKRSSLWLFMGVVAGAAFYQWPVSRTGIAAVGLMYLLVCMRFPIRQLKQMPHLVFGAAGLALLLAPLIGIWLAYPERFMARAYESLPGLKFGGSSVSVDMTNSTLELFFRSLGWLFSEVDRSSQGSISPGLNPLEAILFAVGLVILLIEGASLNILLGLMLIVTLLICGAWSVGPPWYTRLLPTAPIACLAIARAVEGVHNLCNVGKRRLYWGAFAAISAVLLIAGPAYNFKRYYEYETAITRRTNLDPMAAVGRKLNEYGPKYKYIFLLFGEPSWRFQDLPAFGHMMPYISNLQLKESYDVKEELPVKQGESKGFLVQVKRFDIDLPEIKKYHPNAQVVKIEHPNHELVAYLVLVDG